jgi:hypothetical protein
VLLVVPLLLLLLGMEDDKGTERKKKYPECERCEAAKRGGKLFHLNQRSFYYFHSFSTRV